MALARFHCIYPSLNPNPGRDKDLLQVTLSHFIWTFLRPVYELQVLAFSPFTARSKHTRRQSTLCQIFFLSGRRQSHLCPIFVLSPFMAVNHHSVKILVDINTLLEMRLHLEE